MRQYIQAKILNMAEAEILEIIPKDTIERIKQGDPHPEFRVYGVGNEGVAHAQELSFGQKINKAFHYVRDMIFKIADKIQYGTPFYQGHAKFNTAEGRERLGEVVGKGLKMINNVLTAVAVAYLYPQFRKMQLDIASIEADIVYVPKSATAADVIDVQQVTGIALGNSATEKPAFAGATLLGAIQALRGAETREEVMTKEEIKAAIKEANLSITDIFSPVEIIDSEPAQEAKKKERGFAKRKEEELNAEHEKVIDLQKKLDETTGKVKVLTQKVNAGAAKTHIDASLAGRKLDPKEKEFIAQNAAKFASDKEGDELKQDVERFVDAQVKEFEGVAKLTGYAIKRPDTVPVNETPEAKAAREAAAAGTPATDGTDGAGDMTSPEKNDFIPGA